MRVYLLHPPSVSTEKPCPSFIDARGGTYWYAVWLSCATGVVEDAGYRARLVDASAKGWEVPKVRNDIDSFDPDVLVIESNFSSVKNNFI